MTQTRGQRLGEQATAADTRQQLPFLSPLTFHPRVPPLTHSSFDGDSFSTVGASTKIENTSWSADIPSDAVALLIDLQARDSAVAVTAGLFFTMGPTATYYYALTVGPIGDDARDYNTGICPATDGDVYYRLTASGAGTMDVIMRCWGYWK